MCGNIKTNQELMVHFALDRYSLDCTDFAISLTRGLFLESPETFRAHFGWHNSLRIFKTKASGGTKLCSYFRFYSLYNIWKDQLYRIIRWEFYEWLFGPGKFSGLSRNGPQVLTRWIISTNFPSQFVLLLFIALHYRKMHQRTHLLVIEMTAAEFKARKWAVK
mgnify:CR=1 FL=1